MLSIGVRAMPPFLACVLVAVLASLVLPGAAAGAPGGLAGPSDRDFNPAGDSENNHCFVFGSDTNATTGISEQFITGVFCAEADAGEFWLPVSSWFTTSTTPVYPSGYTPAASTPSADFVSKLAAVRVVIDPGTRQEKSYTYPGPRVTRVDRASELFPDRAGGWNPDFAVVSVLPKVQPQRIGVHAFQVYWSLTAAHCDGLGTDTATHCLPAGETLFETIFFGERRSTRSFEVTPGASQSGTS